MIVRTEPNGPDATSNRHVSHARSEKEGDRITFTVNRPYKGVQGDTVTLAGATALEGATSAGSLVGLQPGTRLLVAGSGGFAWPCGFTQPYDPMVAASWQSTLSG